MTHKFTFIVSLVLALFASYVGASTKSVEGVAKPPQEIKLQPEMEVISYMGLVEEYLAGVLRETRILANTSEAKTLKWETIKPLLVSYAKDLETDATVWFMLPDGSYYSTETGGLTPENLKNRDYFPKLLKGESVDGDLVISKSTGHRSIIVATPVRVNGQTVAAIGVSLRARLLSSLIERHTHLPENTYFYAMTPSAKIAIHRYADRMFKQAKDVGDEILEEDFKKTFKREQGTFAYELKGKRISTVYRKSTPLGWYFFIAQEKNNNK